MKPIIEIENVSKKYQIGTRESYSSLRDSISQLFNTRGRKKRDEFWALKDIQFKISAGESLGVIGRNGAGKSTLLKILSQITPPTTGKITMRGRVASLLEVGTGFHPELTGRENIFLNGAILGMSRVEIRKKFDEIVEFSGIEKFLDTPVKRYSSGMYVRLAFAVAAHLEPEILIVDEVLAVGDAAFQRKCLAKMENVGQQGRTVIFVSHNMSAIRILCKYGIYLKDGLGSEKLKIDEAIDLYSKDSQVTTNTTFPVKRIDFSINNFSLQQKGQALDEYDAGLAINVRIDFEVKENINLFRLGFFLKSPLGDVITRSLAADWTERYENLKKGKYTLKGTIPPNMLLAGNYIIELHASRFGIVDYLIGEEIRYNFKVTSPILFNLAHKDEGSTGTILINPGWVLEYDKS